MPNRIKIDNLQQETKELSDSEQKEIVGGATLASRDGINSQMASLSELNTASSLTTQEALNTAQKAEAAASNLLAKSTQTSSAIISNLK